MTDVLIILFLILLNGFFAMSEIAVVSAKKTKLETERKKGRKGAARAIQLQSDPDNFLSSVQVGITLIGIINGAYGGATLAVYLEPFFNQFVWVAPYSQAVSMAIVVILITYVSIVVGELVPKTIALNNPERVAVWVARPIYAVSVIFFPLVRILAVSTSLVNKLIGIKPKDDRISEMELRAMLRTASNEGIIESEENIIHEQVFYFSDKRARHLMTYRIDVEWVDISKPTAELINELLQAKHSRVLASNKVIDDFVGVINLKEVLGELYKKRDTDFQVQNFIQEPLIVPSTLRAQKLLEMFRHNYKFMAVVVDEYGSLDGVITLHDIMENLVGSMPNESEAAEPDIFMRNENSALVNGEAPIEILTTFIEDFIIDFEEIDYSTVAGFVLSNINKIPQVGDSFAYRGTVFEIVDVDGNKIDKVLINRNMNQDVND